MEKTIEKNEEMFCYQCQETAKNIACTKRGVCGKTSDVANIEDLLVWVTKGLGEILTRMRKENKDISNLHSYVNNNLFTTITNANFYYEDLLEKVKETIDLNQKLIEGLDDKENLSKAALYNEKDDDELKLKSQIIGVLNTLDDDKRSLRELITYGLKGMAAYNRHANVLGKFDENVDEFMESTLAKLMDDSLSVEDLIDLTLQTGSNGAAAMALLDSANTSAYGNPEISEVNIGVRNNPAILISGHDLKDMEMLLEQTQNTGVDVYTHSEMLPANYYPAFKKYDNFVGNYGNSWWLQDKEFESFNGPILMTTNCITPPKDSYKDRVFTTGVAAYPGMKHIVADENGHKDFSEIIELAKKCDSPKEIENGKIVGGFAHNQVLALADKVVEAVKNGDIQQFVVMAGCDGRQKGRNYYEDFAKALPDDTIILTAGCAKYRYNKLNLGDINGIPRVLDAGQCNDSYSLVVIAQALQKAFGLDDINDLPISYNIAWYEQKAVIVLLALLSLGVKNIHLGPTLPAFLSPNVANVLVENFGIAPIGEVDEDMKKFGIKTK
ncbi:hydroxylamine reductase [Finegoldia sp. BIOML-A3]|uniref:hydroxylamine reductase n=1 Tax=Finegoldia TaxID=150022 RepID=UPI0012AFE4EF|nr:MULTISPECIES: hydroxylamine reductase [Finegoldia]MCC2717086.1 hydroxylamine reductase [Finegoldia magna]MDU3804828.1 hydroxylamine reductase [Finegoldia magna]MSA98928.1 hydroxylamine reductase [Finegoldia sp. BIOML-A3]MSB92930.1 hydroxylamine reductase [Finegoldia sp. BIOML-A4]